MTWLSEIEENDKALRDMAVKTDFSETPRERMARVIREQSAVLKDGPWDFVDGDVVGGGYKCRYCQAFLKTYLSPDGIGPTDFIERHKEDCVWLNLSSDAKEVINAS